MTPLTVNGRPMTVHADPATPILWVARDTLGLSGTKFGCSAALCGARTVHLNGQAPPARPRPARRDEITGQGAA